MEGMTVTIVAKNGELILNGVAKDYNQAAQVERIARNVAGGRVNSQFTTQLG
ncbi:BON domain protein [compost metagenome]